MNKIDVGEISSKSETRLDILEAIKDNTKSLSSKQSDFLINISDIKIVYHDIPSIRRIHDINNDFIDEELLDSIYHYRAELYCIEKYGTTNILPYILKLNGIDSSEDFVMEKVKFFTREGVLGLITLR